MVCPTDSSSLTFREKSIFVFLILSVKMFVVPNLLEILFYKKTESDPMEWKSFQALKDKIFGTEPAYY